MMFRTRNIPEQTQSRRHINFSASVVPSSASYSLVHALWRAVAFELELWKQWRWSVSSLNRIAQYLLLLKTVWKETHQTLYQSLSTFLDVVDIRPSRVFTCVNGRSDWCCLWRGFSQRIPVAILITEVRWFLMQCRLNDRRSQAFSILVFSLPLLQTGILFEGEISKYLANAQWAILFPFFFFPLTSSSLT